MIFPRATYRLQLRAGFGFNEAAAVAPYLARLGVSHLYLSPFFKARPGSPHGYDITDHARLNPEIGSEAEYSAMIEAFRGLGPKAILDFVPNHMGVGGADNSLWLALSRSRILLVNAAAHSRTALRKINHLGPSTSARNPPKMAYSWRV